MLPFAAASTKPTVFPRIPRFRRPCCSMTEKTRPADPSHRAEGRQRSRFECARCTRASPLNGVYNHPQQGVWRVWCLCSLGLDTEAVGLKPLMPCYEGGAQRCRATLAQGGALIHESFEVKGSKFSERHMLSSQLQTAHIRQRTQGCKV